MRGRTIVVAAAALTVAGGWAYDRWDTGRRLGGCEERGAQLATLQILHRQPGSLTPRDRYSGCDVDRAIAYAGVPYYGPVDKAELIAFTTRAATADGWRASGTPEAPESNPNPAAFCGEREIDGRTVYLRTSVISGTYEVHVSEHRDSGFACD